MVAENREGVGMDNRSPVSEFAASSYPVFLRYYLLQMSKAVFARIDGSAMLDVLLLAQCRGVNLTP